MKNNLLKITRWHIALLLAVAFILSGCGTIYEDFPGCPMYVNFKYDFNMSYENTFAKECKEVEIFVFDTNGVLRYRKTETGSALTEPGFRMHIPVEYGKYQVVARVGYNHDSYALSDMRVGTSTIQDLTLRLVYAEDNTSDHELDELWYGLETFNFTGDTPQTKTISLVRNTNTVHLKLIDTDADSGAGIRSSDSGISSKITAPNGSYNSLNVPTDETMITYLPYDTRKGKVGEEAPTETMSFSMLRLLKFQSVGFKVINVATGKSLLPPGGEDLINYYLLKGKPANIGDQEFLDREHAWNVELYYKKKNEDYIAVMIRVNNWVVWQQGMDM